MASQKTVEGERTEKSFSLFSDPDLKFMKPHLSTYPWLGEKETESLALPNSIKLEQDKNGAVVLDLIPPRGITSVIEQQFKLLASDRAGLQHNPTGSPSPLRPSPRQLYSHVGPMKIHSKPHKSATHQRKIQPSIFNRLLI